MTGPASSPGPTATAARSRPIGSGRLAGRLLDYWVIVYLRTWKGSVISSFVQPILFVLAMGVLLGGFIEGDPVRLEGATSYLGFVVPGLVAAGAMQVVVGEVTYPVMGMVKWHKTYFSMIATPLSIADVVLAHVGFVMFRVATTCGVFLLVMVPFGVFVSWPGVVAAFFVQILIGLAFALPVYGLSAGLKDESAFALVYRLGVLPMFLFSGAFFPISNLSPPLEFAARLTPLWHGVDLTRMLVLDRLDVGWAAVHVCYLAAIAGLGWLWAVRRLRARMID